MATITYVVERRKRGHMPESTDRTPTWVDCEFGCGQQVCKYPSDPRARQGIENHVCLPKLRAVVDKFKNLAGEAMSTDRDETPRSCPDCGSPGKWQFIWHHDTQTGCLRLGKHHSWHDAAPAAPTPQFCEVCSGEPGIAFKVNGVICWNREFHPHLRAPTPQPKHDISEEELNLRYCSCV